MTDLDLLKEAMDALDPFAARAKHYDPPENDEAFEDWDKTIHPFITYGNLRQARTTHDKLKAALEKPNHNEQLAAIFNDLVARQQPMDHEIEKAWSENTEELYEP